MARLFDLEHGEFHGNNCARRVVDPESVDGEERGVSQSGDMLIIAEACATGRECRGSEDLEITTGIAEVSSDNTHHAVADAIHADALLTDPAGSVDRKLEVGLQHLAGVTLLQRERGAGVVGP